MPPEKIEASLGREDLQERSTNLLQTVQKINFGDFETFTVFTSVVRAKGVIHFVPQPLTSHVHILHGGADARMTSSLLESRLRTCLLPPRPCRGRREWKESFSQIPDENPKVGGRDLCQFLLIVDRVDGEPNHLSVGPDGVGIASSVLLPLEEPVGRLLERQVVEGFLVVGPRIVGTRVKLSSVIIALQPGQGPLAKPFLRGLQREVGDGATGGTKSAEDTCVEAESYQYRISHRPRKTDAPSRFAER